MIPAINSQFKAVRGSPIESVSVGELAAKLETTTNSVVVSHKFVGPLYTTTVYDETERRIYRAHHPKGILSLWKLLALANPRLRLLARSEPYTPKESK